MAKTITLKIQLDGAGKVRSEVDDIGNGFDELAKVDARNAKEALDRIDRTTLNQIKSQIKSVGDTLQQAGDKIKSVGQTLAVGLTVPIVAGAYALGKYGLGINALKNQLTAFEGSAEKAETRLNSLRNLVDKSVGATREMAYSVYSLLKPLNGVSDITIDKTITSLGRLKLAFKDMIPTDFAYNLAQIFGQNFEEQDIKQAIGQVPKFREYLVKALGTGDNETLAEMKKSGKITMDSFFQGIANAVQNDAVLQGLQEPVGLRMQKFFERAFESVEPLANKIVDILAYVLETATPYLQQFGQWFKTLSPYAQNLIIVIAGIAAAIGPVLAVIGSVISFIAPIISGFLSVGVAVSAAGGIFAFLGTVVASVGTFITATLIPAITALAPVILAVVAVVGTLIAAGVALYAAWQTDFGGFKTYTLEVWEVVKSAFQTAMTFIYSIVQSVGGQIVGWWRENYPLIKQIVENVSNAIKSTIGAFLDAVRGFWESHGAAITSYIQTYWGYIKSIVGQVVDQIGSIIRLGLQIINGDWSSAWQTLLKIIENGAKLAATIWRGFLDTLGRLLAAIIPIAIEYGIKFQTTIATWFGKAVLGAVYIIATLPQRIAAIIPKLIASGVSIVKAIWQGIKDGWAGSTASDPLQFPTSAVELSAQNTYGQKTIDYSRPQDLPQKDQIKQVASLDIGKLKDDADKLKNDREAMAKAELSAQINLYQNQISEVEKIYKDSFDKISETFKETNNPQQFQASFDQLKQWYGEQINTLAPAWEDLVKNQTLSEKKGQLEQYEVFQQTQKRKQELGNLTFELEDKAAKLITETQRKVDNETIQSAEQRVQRLTALASSETQTKIQFIQYLAKTGAISENQAAAQSFDISQKLLEAKKHGYEELLKLAKGNSDKEIEFQQQIRLLDFEISQQKIDNAQKVFDAKKQYYDLITGLKVEGTNESIRLQQEIDLLGVINPMERARIENGYALEKLRQDMANDGYGQAQIDEAAEFLRIENARNLELQRILEVRKQVVEVGSIEKSLIGDLTKLQNGGRELTEYEKTLSKINADLKDISDADKQNLLDISAKIDAQKEYNKVYKETYNFIRDTLDILTDSDTSFGEKIKTIFGGIADKLKNNFLDKISATLTTSILGFDPNKSENPVIAEVQTSNNYLKTIAGVLTGNAPQLFGGSPQSGALSGGFGSILGSLLGGRGSSLTGGFAGGASPAAGFNLQPDNLRTVFDRSTDVFSAVPNGSGSIWSQLTGKGGIFGDKGFGNNVGTYGAFGAGANLLGGLIGGRTGGIISGAGSGAAMGASIGSIVPGIGTGIGAGIGGVVGFIAGLFGGGKQKKADQKTYNAAIGETMAQLSALKSQLDARPPTTDPAGALGQAQQMQASYYQAMNALKDKSTRNNSIADGRRRIDPLVTAIGASSAAARAYNYNRQQTASNFVGEFAGGSYFNSAQYADFKRRNGLMPGAYTGRDYLPALIGDGEMVLNSRQIARVRAVAGFDAFAGAGIPNYQQSPETPKFAGGVSFAAPVSSSSKNAPTISLEGVSFEIVIKGEGISKAEIESITLKTMNSPQGRNITNNAVMKFHDNGGGV